MQLVRINDDDVSELSKAEIMKSLKAMAKESKRLTFRGEREAKADDPRALKIDVPPGPLGLAMKGVNGFAAQIVEIKSSSVLKASEIKAGHVIAAVDGSSITTLPYSEVKSLLTAKSKDAKTLTLYTEEVFLPIQSRDLGDLYKYDASKSNAVIQQLSRVIYAMNQIWVGSEEDKEIEREDQLDVASAQKEIYNRTYSPDEIKALSKKELKE